MADYVLRNLGDSKMLLPPRSVRFHQVVSLLPVLEADLGCDAFLLNREEKFYDPNLGAREVRRINKMGREQRRVLLGPLVIHEDGRMGGPPAMIAKLSQYTEVNVPAEHAERLSREVMAIEGSRSVPDGVA